MWQQTHKGVLGTMWRLESCIALETCQSSPGWALTRHMAPCHSHCLPRTWLLMDSSRLFTLAAALGNVCYKGYTMKPYYPSTSHTELVVLGITSIQVTDLVPWSTTTHHQHWDLKVCIEVVYRISTILYTVDMPCVSYTGRPLWFLHCVDRGT